MVSMNTQSHAFNHEIHWQQALRDARKRRDYAQQQIDSNGASTFWEDVRSHAEKSIERASRELGRTALLDVQDAQQ